MSKISLAVKYRPKTFSDVVAQDAIKDILTEQINTKSFKHAYLFCGPAGCGKTTNARIFANDINGGKGAPIEMDAASQNGVNDVREIIESAKKKPLDSDYKIFILDEVHSFSINAWSALLKLLEEPPKTAIFILCTTDPQKIPATILSRVQRYDFSKIPLIHIIDRLLFILDNEEIVSFDRDAVEYIAKAARGGMRDAISLLDKCLSLDKNLSLESVISALGTVDYNNHFDLFTSLATNSPKRAMDIVEEIYNSGKDLKAFMKQFQFFVVDLAKYKMFKVFDYLDIPNLPEYKIRIDDEEFSDMLKILEWCRQLNMHLKWESNVKAVVQTEALLLCGKLQQ